MAEQFCSRCEQLLPEDAFNRYGDRRQWWCRDCFRAYFKARGDVHLEQVKASRVARRATARAFVLDLLATRACADCGQTDPVVLEFDHVGVKAEAVSVLVGAGASAERIRQEIDRCEIVCVNCHRRRTYSRLDDRPKTAKRRRLRDRNLDYVYALLEQSACVDCGVDEVAVLEFDHVGPKRASVLFLAWNDYSLQTIDNEIAQCEVRCANCHRRRTAAELGHYRHLAVEPRDSDADLSS